MHREFHHIFSGERPRSAEQGGHSLIYHFAILIDDMAKMSRVRPGTGERFSAPNGIGDGYCLRAAYTYHCNTPTP